MWISSSVVSDHIFFLFYFEDRGALDYEEMNAEVVYCLLGFIQ